jgi:cytidylate kinase
MNAKGKSYKPGYYGKKTMQKSAWIDANIKRWNTADADMKRRGESPPVFNSICFSRQIGVGALEIADHLSGIIDYRVVDREILEEMARDANLTQKAIAFFDERYPGRMSELFSMLTSEKTFLTSDYARQLAKTVTALANIEPTIFVGRGTQYILPRDRVLSVRFICSRDYRVERLAKLMGLTQEEASKQLTVLDNEQHKFFHAIYQKNETANDDFDLVINRDHIAGVSQIAQIVVCAYTEKFRSPVNKG